LGTWQFGAPIVSEPRSSASHGPDGRSLARQGWVSRSCVDRFVVLVARGTRPQAPETGAATPVPSSWSRATVSPVASHSASTRLDYYHLVLTTVKVALVRTQ